jgi:molybdate transport system substrate-binding protein
VNPAPKLTILSTLAIMGVLQEILPDYERTTAIRMDASFAPTRDLVERIEGGSTGDVAILTDAAIDALIAAGTLAAGSRVDLARSFIGIAVRAGTPQPDIGTVAAFRQTLLDARSIAYSAAGASGLFFAGLIERLGVAEAVRAKATVIPTGFTGALVASGEVELAVQQVSELMVIPGIDIVGRLPNALHGGAVFSGGVFAKASPGAAALLRFLASDAIGPVFQRHGVEPVGAV